MNWYNPMSLDFGEKMNKAGTGDLREVVQELQTSLHRQLICQLVHSPLGPDWPRPVPSPSL